MASPVRGSPSVSPAMLRATYATIGEDRQAIMTIPAKYENGVFKPLEDVHLTEGTRVEVHVPTEEEAPKAAKIHPRVYSIWDVGRP